MVGPEMGKEDKVEWGEFLEFGWPSGVVGAVSSVHSACWSGSWGQSSENPSRSLRMTCVGSGRIEKSGECC